MQSKQKLAYIILLVVLVIIMFALSVKAYAAEQDKKERLFIDAMTVEEFRKCGLFKLSSDELDALDGWMSNTFISLVSYLAGPTSTNQITQGSDANISLYDIQGNPVAYIAAEEKLIIYLWAGKPVAYIFNSSIYGFNGKHLGWFQDGVIYDHKGGIVGTTKEKSLAETIRKQLEALEANKRVLQDRLSRANVPQPQIPQPQAPEFIPPGTTDSASNALFLGLLLIKSRAQENRRLQLEAEMRKDAALSAAEAALLATTELEIVKHRNLLAKVSIKPSLPKVLKQLRPIEGIRELEPLKPLFKTSWSSLSLQLFLSQGAK